MPVLKNTRHEKKGKTIPVKQAKNRRVRLAVHGSRTLSDERVRILLLEAIEQHSGHVVIVTHGEPEGVCEMARRICKEKALPLKLHFLNFRYLRGAFEHRSKAVIEDSDEHILIHDGESKGTANEKKLIEKKGHQFAYHVLPKTEYKKSVGFPVKEDWDNLDLDADEETKDGW